MGFDQEISIGDFLEKLRSGNTRALSRAITLCESQNAEHQDYVRRLMAELLKGCRPSKRIAITGAPGVGKSTIISSLAKALHDKGNSVAVLAIDPSSEESHGSVLGDKLRMSELSGLEGVYVRPSSDEHGEAGINFSMEDSLRLCEYAGFDYILVETVGVGQSEIHVSMVVDLIVLALLPGEGDDIQGLKRGLLEEADVIWVNRSDENLELAKETAELYRSSESLLPHKEWERTICYGSAQSRDGVLDLVESLESLFEANQRTIDGLRGEKANAWFKRLLTTEMIDNLMSRTDVKDGLMRLQGSVKKGELGPSQAAKQVWSELKMKWRI